MAGWMTLIGDLHGRTPKVREDSYLVLLAGDVCPDNNQKDFLTGPFTAWLKSLPCPVVAVGGNHDRRLYEEHDRWAKELPWHLLGPGDHVSVGGVTVWGCPYVLDKGTNFSATEEQIEKALDPMPAGMDILLLHNPPLGILDTPSGIHEGSLAIRYAIWKKCPKLCVFGHVHQGRGWMKKHQTYCINATLGAGCQGNGYPAEAIYPPWGLADNSWKS